MIKTIGKVCISATMALLLSFAIWYFLLIKIPEDRVMGIAAPTMSRQEALDLMHYHGTRVAYIKDGQWFFRRDGEDCKLTRMEK